MPVTVTEATGVIHRVAEVIHTTLKHDLFYGASSPSPRLEITHRAEAFDGCRDLDDREGQSPSFANK